MSPRPPAPTSSASDPGAIRPPAAFGEADLAQLEAALAQQIGPLARILLRKALKNATKLSDLASALEENIPGEEGRRTFREIARKLTP